MPEASGTIGQVIARMEEIGAHFDPSDARRHFHATYLRSTRAFDEELARGGFLDPVWLEAFDVVFANLYLEALAAWDREEAPGAWQVAFATARDRPDLQPVRHVLFGMNVHVNFDLPQALIATISDDEFDDPALMETRERDHMHGDAVLAARVAEEDRAIPGERTVLDRLLTPLNRMATKKFLAEARRKVWGNARILGNARRQGAAQLAARIDELDRLCAARATDLVAPGQVILKLGRRGFGVVLSGA
jgi:hypothetical protein